MKSGVVMGNKLSLHTKHQEVADQVIEQSKTLPLYFVSFCCCVFLLFCLTDEVRVFADKGWYLQPRLGPVLGLSIMTLLSFLKTVQALSYSRHLSFSVIYQYLTRIISIHRIAFLASGAFYIYIHALSLIGFLLSNILLLMFLLFVAKKWDRFWCAMACSTAIAIVVIFRFVIGLWMDDVWLYGLLPDAIADFCNMYL